MKFWFILLLLLPLENAFAQKPVNQFNTKGQRHGVWQKYFEENPSQIRYKGKFEHGREVGLFKFYQLGNQNPAATKFFRKDSDTIDVQFLNQEGEVISEGKMIGEKRIGEWKYYHQNSDGLMMSEFYRNGILNGKRVIYFENGKPTEISFFVNGKLHGEQQIFSKDGPLLKKYTYKDGLLHGPSEVYDSNGNLLIRGEYRDNKHYGIWEYYENGSLKEEKKFSTAD